MTSLDNESKSTKSVQGLFINDVMRNWAFYNNPPPMP